jgi:uncharacterized hydrophobic protein (TIGR00271 family)
MTPDDPRPGGSSFAPISSWWEQHVLSEVDHRAVVLKVREDAQWSSHFAVMTFMSAGIAILGLLLSSPAVVIGAMLISPLMGPIIGLGFGIATFDGREIRRSGVALAAGVVLAVAFCALIVLFSPLQSVTSEITSRTRPNLFDLLVALFSGIAGSYAVIRGRHGAIVGVAIATALMPPLAVVGFGLATMDWQVLAGSTVLFFTNLMTIAASAAVIARLYGFAPDLSPHQTRLQATLITAMLVALAIPLGFSLRQIAWEALASREARQEIVSEFPPEARVSQLDIDFRARPVEVAATVLTPQYEEAAEKNVRQRLAGVMGGPIVLSLDQIRTENAAQLSAENQQSQASAAERSASRVAERLALIAGVPVENVLVDRSAQRAFVRAAVLPGADLATYRELETRVASGAAGWTVTLVPPVMPLAPVPVAGGQPDQAALDTAIWAARRLRLPVGISGPSEESALVLDQLQQSGVIAKLIDRRGSPGAVKLEWMAPDQGSAPGRAQP